MPAHFPSPLPSGSWDHVERCGWQLGARGGSQDPRSPLETTKDPALQAVGGKKSHLWYSKTQHYTDIERFQENQSL